jgi:hypothetical protein
LAPGTSISNRFSYSILDSTALIAALIRRANAAARDHGHLGAARFIVPLSAFLLEYGNFYK